MAGKRGQRSDRAGPAENNIPSGKKGKEINISEKRRKIIIRLRVAVGFVFLALFFFLKYLLILHIYSERWYVMSSVQYKDG